MAKTRYEDLPYRACVGMMVLNQEGHVFIGRRLGGPEHTDDDHVWQMPQGGVDEGEDLYRAALRELEEETSIRSVTKIGEVADWLTYDIPSQIAAKAWKGKYRGQTQKWFAFRFTGNDEGNQHSASGRRPQAGIRRMALGADAKSPWPDHPVQARRSTSRW